MLNRPWINPSSTDWTDALNPLAKPGFSQNNNPYAYAQLKDPIMQALRLAQGIQPRAYVGPDDRGRSVPAGQTVDFEVPIEPNCYVWALNASSLPPTGGDIGSTEFLFNVIDSGTGAAFFSQPISSRNFNASITGLNNSGVSGNRGPLFLLSKPQLYVPPNYPVIRVINPSQTDAVRCWVTLFAAVEYDLS